MRAVVIAALLALATGRVARAQAVDLAALEDDAAPAGVAGVETGVDMALVARLGYTRRAHVGDFLATGAAALTIPVAGVDLGDLRVDAGAALVFVDAGRWKMRGGLGASVRTADQTIARLVAIGAGASVVGGYYRRGWFAAAELGLDAALTTHVSHHDAYRALVYADAADGWYRLPGGTFREGVQLGVRAGSFELTARAGKLQTFAGGAPLMPIYGVLGVSHAW
jgi:hypothetical protein